MKFAQKFGASVVALAAACTPTVSEEYRAAIDQAVKAVHDNQHPANIEKLIKEAPRSYISSNANDAAIVVDKERQLLIGLKNVKINLDTNGPEFGTISLSGATAVFTKSLNGNDVADPLKIAQGIVDKQNQESIESRREMHESHKERGR